ncbi:uncharacterized protein BXZ73DRAFT_102290 [Epithele typhae]|uniref:uncharacterized protein n=1 Tax=Epithele typhae TaxID=378194 RepID=UPI002008B01D|nr:uncharacterized protein BXZ73DRAFT_102290 [Epithele typhae]KAH9928448.1 hypothetical protein BXZ73DRAFT_102290 [Epithele typhae]
MREAFLRRSQQTLLDLRLCDDPDGHLDSVVLECAPRVRNLSIACSSLSHKHQPFEPGSKFLNLESLSITAYNLPDGLFPTRPPKLRTIILVSEKSLPALPYAALTRLVIQQESALSINDVREALSACASTLKDLVFCIDHAWRYSSGDALPPIHLPRLETLFARNPGYLLELLSIPPSTAVTLEDCDHNVPDWFVSGGSWTTLALDYGAEEITAVLTESPADARGTPRRTLRYCTTLSREDVERAILALVPWTQLETVALRATARMHTAMAFLAHGLRRTRGGIGRLQSVYVASRRSRKVEAVAAAVKELGEVIGGYPEASEVARREPLRLAKLEIWAGKRAFLEQLCIGGQPTGVERVVLHCPETAEPWVQQMQREVPQLEVHALKGAAVKEARLPALDEAIKDGMYRWWD